MSNLAGNYPHEVADRQKAVKFSGVELDVISPFNSENDFDLLERIPTFDVFRSHCRHELDVVAHEYIMEDGFQRRIDIGFRHKAQPSVTSINVLAGTNVARSSTLRLLPSSLTSASVNP